MKIQIEFDIPDTSFFIHATVDYLYEKNGKREFDSQERFTKEIREIKHE